MRTKDGSAPRTAGGIRYAPITDQTTISGDFGVLANCGKKNEKNIANAHHLVACWNAIESIGGDPETVVELRAGLERIDLLMSGDENYEHTWINAPIKPEKSPADEVRAILAKIKGCVDIGNTRH